MGRDDPTTVPSESPLSPENGGQSLLLRWWGLDSNRSRSYLRCIPQITVESTVVSNGLPELEDTSEPSLFHREDEGNGLVAVVFGRFRFPNLF